MGIEPAGPPHNLPEKSAVQTSPPPPLNFHAKRTLQSPPPPPSNFYGKPSVKTSPPPSYFPRRPGIQTFLSSRHPNFTGNTAPPNSSLSPPFSASHGPAFASPDLYSSPISSLPLHTPPQPPPPPPLFTPKPITYPYHSPPLQQQNPSIAMTPSLSMDAGSILSAPPTMHRHENNRKLDSSTQIPLAGSPKPEGVDLSALQSLVENFSSLSIPASDSSVGPGAQLPRPLGMDVEEPTPVYPQNCHPRYFRLTTSVMPSSQSLLSRWHFPLGAVVHPLAEAPDEVEIPTINLGPSSIVRCGRCCTYINPYVTFADSGRIWRCNICHFVNDVPGDYFSPLDVSGRRCDEDQRPELSKGSVEYVASASYMNRPPMPPSFFFLIDVSFYAVRSGTLEVVAKTIKSCLDVLPGFPRTQIGFLTYDSALHFYNLKSCLIQPQMMVISDLEDIFVPLPDELLVNLSESRNVVDAFLDSLPSMFHYSENFESAFGPALKAALMVMGHLGGKLLIFQSTLPSLGVDCLKLRGDADAHPASYCAYGTHEESAIRRSEDPFYEKIAAELTKNRICVNVYAFSEKYTDLASLGTLLKKSGGQVYYYPRFQGIIHGEKLRHDLTRDLTRETAWEAMLRIRCGKRVRVSTYHGHFMMRSWDAVFLPALDCDKAFAIQITLDDSLLSTQTIYFQIALVYTLSSGERRIRVHTAAAPVVNELSEMYRCADAGAIISVLTRLGIEKSLFSKLEDTRCAVQQKIVKGLKEFRNLFVAQHNLTGRMIYSESLKYLPLYGLAIAKSIAFRGGFDDVKVDERCAAGFSMMTLPVKKLLKFLYPNLFRIDEYLLKGPFDIADDGSVVKQLPLTSSILDPEGLFLFDDGFRFILWFGCSLSPEITVDLVGADMPDMSKITLSEQDNNTSRKLFSLLKKLREEDPSSYQSCHLVRQGEQPGESILLSNLIDDPTGGAGYVEYIQYLHRQTSEKV